MKSLRALREERGWSQERLARRARLSVRTVARIERGKGAPSMATANKLAKALGVTIDDLLQPPEKAAV